MQADTAMNVGAVLEFCFMALAHAIFGENLQRPILIWARLNAGAGEMRKRVPSLKDLPGGRQSKPNTKWT